VPDTVNCIVRELAIAPELLVVTSFKNPINSTTNLNPVFSHLTRDNI
jgi:hypothetical protein